MISPEAERRIARILLGLDTAGTGLQDIESILLLARVLEAELTALFIEDDDLLRSAALPFTTEIPLSGGDARALDVARLERSLRHLARRMEAELAQAAERAQVRWAFRILRGRRLPTLLAEAGVEDLLVLARTPHSTAEARQAAQAHTVAVVFDGSDSARHAVALAARLVGQDGHDLLLLDVAPAGKGLDVRAARQWLLERGIPATRRTLSELTAGRLLEALRGNVPLLLILPADHPAITTPGFIDRLRRHLPSPLALLR
ncbi:MAG TPA: hypothetical protein ENN42_02085 [Thioalkalivibrio sp.]|nr:hypothetical protein [Thioalkalivibrio sp.]